MPRSSVPVCFVPTDFLDLNDSKLYHYEKKGIFREKSQNTNLKDPTNICNIVFCSECWFARLVTCLIHGLVGCSLIGRPRLIDGLCILTCRLFDGQLRWLAGWRVCMCLCVTLCSQETLFLREIGASAGGSSRSLGTATNEDSRLIWWSRLAPQFLCACYKLSFPCWLLNSQCAARVKPSCLCMWYEIKRGKRPRKLYITLYMCNGGSPGWSFLRTAIQMFFWAVLVRLPSGCSGSFPEQHWLLPLHHAALITRTGITPLT